MMKLLTADKRQLPLVADYGKIAASLPEEDRLRAERFVRAEDRIRCAAGAFLVRQSVKDILTAKGKEPVFCIGRSSYGKPYVKEFSDIHFSLSHSGAMIALFLSDSEVGVDVEEIKDIDVSDYTAFFSRRETQLLSDSPEPLRDFYRIWTVREAFSKKVGTGLSLYENEKVDIDYAGGRVFCRGGTSFVKSFLLDGHILSICTEGEMPGIQPHFIDKTEWKHMLFT